MDEQDVYTPQEDMNNNVPITVSKGPFYGLVLAIIGILFIISSTLTTSCFFSIVLPITS